MSSGCGITCDEILKSAGFTKIKERPFYWFGIQKMQILDLHNSIEQKQWIDRIRVCDWGAAKYLADLLEQDKFYEMAGEGSLLILTEEEKLVTYACNKAKEQGFDNVYIATDHIGLYEKYGFTYIESRIDLSNDVSRIYYRKLV